MSQNTLLKISAIALILGAFAGLLVGVSVLLSDLESSGSFPAIYCCAFMPLLITVIFSAKKRKKFIMLKIIKKSRLKKLKGESSEMLELAKRFIDKDCVIVFYDGNYASGIIKEVTDNAMLIEEKGELIAINLEFVARIKEFPKNKNGKRKSAAY